MPGHHFPVYNIDSNVPARIYPWMRLEGEVRAAAVEVRRKDLLHRILTLDPNIPNESIGYKEAKEEWDALLQYGQMQPSWPNKKRVRSTPALANQSNGVMSKFLDFIFGAKHICPPSRKQLDTVLSGRLRSTTYHGRVVAPSGTSNQRRRTLSMMQNKATKPVTTTG
eukprot:m.340302 g.340302  ORF g.340302 m.340302 type:complete len:167 (+) comp19229_c0_seq1:152-652(+)